MSSVVFKQCQHEHGSASLPSPISKLSMNFASATRSNFVETQSESASRVAILSDSGSTVYDQLLASMVSVRRHLETVRYFLRLPDDQLSESPLANVSPIPSS